jgi:hypothetical protein
MARFYFAQSTRLRGERPASAALSADAEHSRREARFRTPTKSRDARTSFPCRSDADRVISFAEALGVGH